MQAVVSPILDRAPVKAGPNFGLVAVILLALAICLGLVIAVDPAIAYLAVVAVAGPAVAYYVVSRPSVAVAVALASHAWAVELAGPYLTPFKIAGVLALFVVARDIVQKHRVHPVPKWFAAGMVALLLLVATSELLAEYEGSIAPFFEFGGTLVVFLLLTQTILTSEDIRTFSRVYAINLLLTFASVWREVGWAALGESGTRASGICGQPNVLGNHLAMSLPFALALLLDRKASMPWRLLGLFAALGSAYGEWGAASRGGTIGYMFALFTFALLAPRRPTVRVTAVVVAVLAAMAFSGFSPKSFSRVTETFDGSTDIETATSERALHARIGADMLPRHPFLGFGITAFGYERSRYSGTLGGALHSSVLAVAVSYGVPALALYILLQLSGVVMVVRNLGSGPLRIYHAGLASAAVAAITSGLSGTELFRAEQWGLVSMCYIAALRHHLNTRPGAPGQSGA